MDSISNKFWGIIESLALWFLKVFFKVIRKELTDGVKESFVQFVKFGVVGVSNTVLSYVLNVIVLLLLQKRGVSWDYIAGNTIAFIVSVAWSFYWNNKYVFAEKEGQKRNLFKALLKTYISYAFTGIILTNILSFVWINVFDISKFIAPIINLIVSVPLNFIINKLWAFRS